MSKPSADRRESIRADMLHRFAEIETREFDAEQRQVAASLSSEQPVQRWFGYEVLAHDEGAINLERAAGGALPLLWNHDTDAPLGAARGFKIKDGRLRGELTFSEHASRPEVWRQLQDGVPLGVSIGYRIDEWTEDKDDNVRVTKWTLHEVSIVAVPADHTVGVNRKLSERGSVMDTNEDRPVDGTDAQPVNTPAHLRVVREQGEQIGIRKEHERIMGIRHAYSAANFQTPDLVALRDFCIDNRYTVEQSRTELLKALGDGIEPLSVPLPQESAQPQQRAGASMYKGRVDAGEDQTEKFRKGAVDALMARSGLVRDAAAVRALREGNEFASFTLTDLAREALARQNVSTRGMDMMRAIGMAFTQPGTFSRSIVGHGVSDFANVLLDAANKSMLAGWEEAPETFGQWTRSMSVSDFKANALVNLSNFGDLDVVPEHAEYKYGSFSDVKETITLRTYGKLFSITRQAIVNDDLMAFTQIPNKMGRAAARMVGDEAYGVLTANPTLNQDSLALFHSTHANYVTSGAAPTVTTVNTGFTAMAVQTDPGGATINVVPSYIIVPRALEVTARNLAVATYDPAGTSGNLTPNPFQGRLTVVADARLDAFNSSGWFLAANPSQVGTVVVAYLNGQTTPYLEQQQAFTQDGVAFKVRMDCRAAAEDFRGLYYNDGVT